MLAVSVADFSRDATKRLSFENMDLFSSPAWRAWSSFIGAVNDLITSSISPEYFTLGKGLDEGPDLRLRAGLFGLQVGFSAGVIGGAVCLFASRRKSSRSPVRFSRLFQLLWMPVTGAIFCGVALPLAFSQFDPAKFSDQLNTLLDAERNQPILAESGGSISDFMRG